MSKGKSQRKGSNQKEDEKPPKAEKQASWAAVRGLLTCRNVQIQHQKQEHRKKQEEEEEESSKKCKKMRCSGSLCNNTKVMARPDTGSPDAAHKIKRDTNDASSNRSMRPPLNELPSSSSSSSHLSLSSNSSVSGSFRGMPFRRFSGCYECRMVVDPLLGFTRDPSLRSSICPCPHCGQIFMKPENLELHQAVKHAVSEVGPEDTSKNIVEIIFHSSWMKKQSPVCKIDRILKVHNTQRTITKFEEYRESIKAKAMKLSKKHPRCIADGNELLRFHCTSSVCSLGLKGSSNLCNSTAECKVCSIIKNGFKVVNGSGKGILTTATSGKAHDKAEEEEENKKKNKAMVVCRVIAGRVMKKNNVDQNQIQIQNEEYDSIAGEVGAYSNLEELYVFNARAILPCFVVFYSGF